MFVCLFGWFSSVNNSVVCLSLLGSDIWVGAGGCNWE